MFMRSTCLSIAVLSALAAPALATTSQPSAVVELFTSQGCSSCPPANAFVTELDQSHTDVLALSYGVTYWDYLGWKDTFGHPDFTKRQKAYDAALDSGVYTPMLVVAGRHHGPRLTEATAIGTPIPASLKLAAHAGMHCIEGDLPVGSKLALVEYRPGTKTVSVKSGENHGRTLTLTNVVTAVRYKDWSGEPICGLQPEQALAVLAHDAQTSAIIGAARYEP